MPLIVSPIDGTPMKQIKRYGIEIDVCPTTGGIWLDRGELEKLIQFIQEETSSSHHCDDDDDDRRHYHGGGYAPSGYKQSYKQKSKASRLMDLFDF